MWYTFTVPVVRKPKWENGYAGGQPGIHCKIPYQN